MTKILLIALIIVALWSIRVLNGQKIDCSKVSSIWGFTKCCDAPTFLDEKILDKCSDENMIIDSGLDMKNILCNLQCYFNATHLYTEDGKIDVEGFKAQMSSKFTERTFSHIPKIAFDTCVENVINKEVELRAAKDNAFSSVDSKCDFMIALFYACVQVNVFRNCPVSHWVICEY